MNGEFFLLAFGAALNPKLLAIDLLLARNRRARAMFLCVLIGGISVALTIGLIDVLVIQADAVNVQGRASAGVDLALGILLLAIGALIFTGRLPMRRARPQCPRCGEVLALSVPGRGARSSGSPSGPGQLLHGDRRRAGL